MLNPKQSSLFNPFLFFSLSLSLIDFLTSDQQKRLRTMFSRNSCHNSMLGKGMFCQERHRQLDAHCLRENGRPRTVGGEGGTSHHCVGTHLVRLRIDVTTMFLRCSNKHVQIKTRFCMPVVFSCPISSSMHLNRCLFESMSETWIKAEMRWDMKKKTQ